MNTVLLLFWIVWFHIADGVVVDDYSGVRGVSYSSTRNRWVASITVRGRSYKEFFPCDSRGRGDTTAFDAAVQARRNMEQMYRCV